MREFDALERIASMPCLNAETSADWDCFGAGLPEDQLCAVCVARAGLGWRKGSAHVEPEEEKRIACGQRQSWRAGDIYEAIERARLSPSEFCKRHHVQNCHACEDANCHDNITASIKALRETAERWRRRAQSPHYDGEGNAILWSALFADAEARVGVLEAMLKDGSETERPPTKWAYEQACSALWKHRDDAQASAHVIVRLGVSHEDLDACGCEECERVRRGLLGAGFLKPRNEDEAQHAGP